MVLAAPALLGALDADRVATLGLLMVIGLVIVAAVVAALARAVAVKVIAAVALVGLGLVVWSQRAQLQDCAQEVKDGVVQAGPNNAPCEFLGLDVSVTLP